MRPAGFPAVVPTKVESEPASSRSGGGAGAGAGVGVAADGYRSLLMERSSAGRSRAASRSFV